MKFLLPLLLVSSLCFAAPPAQLPQSGQTKCYDAAGAEVPNCTGTGQDGEYLAGVAWDPETRFWDNEDGTVTDKLTGLIWAQNGDPRNDGAKGWQLALDYIKELNNQNYKGFNDWRLPNLHELKSLLTYQEVPSIWLSTRGVFANVRAANYWTSTTNAGDPTKAWWVNLGTAVIDDFRDKFSGGYVWPVRGDGVDGVIMLPKTGQTACWGYGSSLDCAGTGQDGEHRKGVAWPSSRFKDMNDGTIRDNLTGLLWSKDAFPAAAEMNWQGALTAVSNLNTIKYLGYDNWRLPNPLELASLVNAGNSNNNTWLGDQGFQSVMADYWTATTDVAGSGSVWRATISDASTLSRSKSELFNTVWPVRTDNTPPETTATPAGGTYITPQTVTLSANEPATIYYTTNGAVPTIESATYSSSLNVGSNMELKFFAVDELGNTEGVKTEPYVFIQAYPLTLSFGGSGDGSVSGDMSCVSGAVCPPKLFASNAVVNLIPLADSGSIFTGWSGACANTSGNCSFTMDSAKNVTATFTAAPKVKVGAKEFSSLQAAYNDAATLNNAVIKLLEGAVAENVIFGRNINVILEGGYDATYAKRIAKTTIIGRMQLRVGTVRMNKVNVK